MLADLAIGIFSAILAGQFFQIKINLLTVLIGVIFALLPDSDSIISWIKKGRVGGKFDHHHRDLLHLPLPYIFIGSFLVFWFGPVWLFMFIFNSLMHFLHDSFGIGWGVKWIYPFSEKSYKLFSFRKFIVSWTPEEREKIAEKYGDENWIRNIYLRPTVISISELLFFIASLISIIFYLN